MKFKDGPEGLQGCRCETGVRGEGVGGGRHMCPVWHSFGASPWQAPLASSDLDITSVCAHRTGFVSLAIPDGANPRQSCISGTEEQMLNLKLVC